MGRAGRGGGGGRSGGFSGGSRRSGGFSSSGRSGRSSASRSSRSFSGSRSPSFRGPGMPFFPPRSRTIIFAGSRGAPPSRDSGGGQDQEMTRSGCLATAIVLTVLLLIFLMVSSAMGSRGGAVSSSTVKREPLPAGSVQETGYYTDELGWIVDSSKLTQGMKSFYRETGVQPYLYITDSINGSHAITPQALGDYSAQLYEELFADEAHFLVVFCEYGGEYTVGYTIGSQAGSVLDDEAVGIFRDYLDRYYYEDISEEEFFSNTFAETGERIMTVTRSLWPVVFLVFGIVLLAAILFIWWKKKKEQQAAEAKRMEEMLKTPIETFGDTAAEELAKKYEQQAENGSPSQKAASGAGKENQ